MRVVQLLLMAQVEILRQAREQERMIQENTDG